MRSLTLLLAALPFVSLLASPASAQGFANLQARLQEVRRSADSARHERAVFLADSLAHAHPGHPSVALARAIALAGARRTSDAAEVVRKLLRWDARYARRALQEPALAPVKQVLDTADIAARAARMDAPFAAARAWAVLEERDLVPEGTAWDPSTRSVLVGSLNKNKIVAIAEDGTVSERAGRASGLGSVVGIHVDTIRRTLWVASNARYDQPTDTTTPALLALDVRTGALRSRHPPPEGGKHFFNDITSAPDGTVYLTATDPARVWVLRPGATTLEPFAAIGPVTAPNGITISDDGRHLFVADLDHVQVVALDRGESWRLATPDSVNVSGIDGLAFADGALIAHHWGVFWRVARYPMDRGYRAITGRSLLEANTADSRTAPTGEVVNGEYVFIGNSQIDRMNVGTLDSATMEPVRMYRVSLAPRSREAVAVSLSERDSVALLDAHTLDRMATLPVGRDPHEISVSRDRRRAFVANAHDTTISVIQYGEPARVAATWALPDSISVHDVDADPDGRTVWAVAAPKLLLLEIDAASGAIRRRLPVQRAGGWMVESEGPAGAVVVANLEGGAVTLVDRRSGRERILPGAEGEIDAAATPDGREVWSVNFRAGTLTIFDARSGRQVSRETSLPGAGRVLFTPDGRTALIVQGGDSTIAAYDVRARRRTSALSVPAGPKVIAISADGRRAYVTHPERGALTAIDVASMTLLRTVPLLGAPDGVALLRE
jgi:DNA-binding beta-propeller fold protein YncE